MNERFGVRFTLIFGGLGLVISPLCIIVPLGFEGPLRLVVHVLLRMTADFSFATVTLNVLQNLLQVVGEKNRALSIAAYTTLIALTSAFGPMIGVAIYTAFGADQNGIVCAFLVICGLRILSGSGLVFRWWKLRKRGNILYETTES